MQIQLRQQERLAAVGQLAGGIAHDFNNILASIILYAQMPLDADELPPKAKHACQTILQESHRAADLVQQILDFSRSAMVETEPLDLADLIQESLTLLRRTIPEHIRLVSEVTCRPCIIQADPTRIHQVLMNLTLNAKDAMPDGGQITIGLQSVRVAPDDEPPVPDMSPGAWAYITVSDTGVGMSDEVRSHLFEPFFTTKEEGEGTGLGLAQVYGIVKQHHGLIDVDTAPGEGTTFAVYFPLIQNGSEPGSEEEETVPLEGNGEKILVVEDADPLRQAVRAGLEAFGYRVVTATDGRAALETLVHDDIDLVLTDVVMPGMGGEELLKHLREQGHGTKVIAMTGHVVDIDVQGLRAEGFAEALPKPFSIEQLAAVVRRTLRGS
jgi:CheY-like chemotaxis protein